MRCMLAAFISMPVIPSFEVTRAVGGRSPRSWIGPVNPLFFHGCLVAQVDHLVPSSLRGILLGMRVFYLNLHKFRGTGVQPLELIVIFV